MRTRRQTTSFDIVELGGLRAALEDEEVRDDAHGRLAQEQRVEVDALREHVPDVVLRHQGPRKTNTNTNAKASSHNLLICILLQMRYSN